MQQWPTVTKFLRKKFTPPHLPHNFIENEHLTNQLLDTDNWRICFVNAGAGYGKSSLLAKTFIAMQESPDYQPLWMTFYERDAHAQNVAHAFAHLFAPLSDCFKELEDEFQNSDASNEELLIELINCADESINQNITYTVFLDAYDVAVSLELDRILIFLIENMSDSFRFIISGSYISPRLEDLRFDIPFIQINNSDLILSDNEFQALASRLLPDISDDELNKICDLADCWPVSFAFANLASVELSRTNISAVQALEKYSKRFFEKEIFSRISPEVYEFLVETAFLDFLDPQLCNFVLETDTSKEILEYLESHNMYVYLDNETGRYGRTKLFRMFLLDKFAALHPRIANRLCTRATTWCNMHSLELEKLKYLVLSSDVSFIEGSIEASVGIKHEGDDESLMQYLLEQPCSKYVEDPFLAWSGVWALVTSGFPAEGRAGLEMLRENGLAQTDGLAYQYMISICTALEGDSAGSLEIIRGLLNNPELKIPRLFQCLLIHMEGENEERLGNVKAAKDLYIKASSLAERENSPFCILFDYYLLGQYFLNVGDYEEANFYLKKGLTLCPKDSPIQGAFLAASAQIMLEHGNFDDAREQLKAALDRVTLNANIDMYADTYVTLARWYSLQGNDIKALEILSNLLDEMYGKTIPRNIEMKVHASRIAIALNLDETPTLRISERVIDGFLNDVDMFRSVPCLLAKAKIIWHSGSFEEAFNMMNLCEEKIQEIGSSFMMAFMLVFRCKCFIELEEETKAMVELNRAIELAMSNGYLAVFLEGGQAIHELIVKLVTSRKTAYSIKKYAQQILRVFESNAEFSETNYMASNEVSGYYALTAREREILNKLNAGMSRLEIAQSLSIADNTVKSHLKKIYSKLGVHSRAEAYKVSQEGSQAERAGQQRENDGLTARTNPQNNPE